MGFEIGQKLVYGIHGVCSLTGIQNRRVDGKTMEYYELSSVERPDSRFYIPTRNPAAVAKLHPLITRQELDDLLASVKNEGDGWIPDENQRKNRYRELVGSFDRKAMICMVSALISQQKARASAGKKLHMCDENFLRDARKLIVEEFSLVLGLPKEQIGEYIQKSIGK